MKAIIITPAYTHVDYRTQKAIMESRITWLPIYEMSDLPLVRSLLVSFALNTDAERIIFLDSDVIPSAEHLQQLQESKYITATKALWGLYPLKNRRTWSANALVKGKTPKGRFQITHGGLGFCAVHRKSLERVRALLPELQHEQYKWHPFCVPVVEGATYMADDRSLCHRLISTGTELWAHTDLVAKHAVLAELEKPDR